MDYDLKIEVEESVNETKTPNERNVYLSPRTNKRIIINGEETTFIDEQEPIKKVEEKIEPDQIIDYDNLTSYEKDKLRFEYELKRQKLINKYSSITIPDYTHRDIPIQNVVKHHQDILNELSQLSTINRNKGILLGTCLVIEGSLKFFQCNFANGFTDGHKEMISSYDEYLTDDCITKAVEVIKGENKLIGLGLTLGGNSFIILGGILLSKVMPHESAKSLINSVVDLFKPSKVTGNIKLDENNIMGENDQFNSTFNTFKNVNNAIDIGSKVKDVYQNFTNSERISML